MRKAESERKREGENESGTVREKGTPKSRDRGMKAGRDGKMAWARIERTVG